MQANKTKTFWDHLNAVIKYQDKHYFDKLSEDDRKSWSTYMMMRYLSMNPDWIELVDLIQPYVHTMRNEDVYKVLLLIIDIGPSWIKYIKKDKKNEFKKELIEKTVKVFECSSKEAEEYISIMDKQALTEMLDMFGLDKRRINSLLKEK